MRKVRFTLLVLALIAAAGQTAAAQTSHPITPATNSTEPVPDSLIAKLRAELVKPDDPGIDTDKIRRYRSILRLGRAAEQNYPAAPNLYKVHSVMLEAGRDLLVMQAEGITPDDVLEIARKINQPEVPPEWRLQADLALTQLEVSRSIDESRDAGQLIRDFAERYWESTVEIAALMHAVEMALQSSNNDLTNALGDRLEELSVDNSG